MADCSNLLQTGLELVQQAIRLDQAGNLRDALRLYSLALESFVRVLQMEKNERIVSTLKGKVSDYMLRAEQIKEILSKEKQPSIVTTSLATISPPRQLPAQAQRIALTADSPTTPKSLPQLHKPQDQTLHAQSIKIKQGQAGCSYAHLFGKYIPGASVVIVEDPYIRSNHQIYNFLRFCELVVKMAGGPVLITLTTSADNLEQQQEITSKINEMKASLREYQVDLHLDFNENLHDREIRLNNGWVIKIGRGLDIYTKPTSKFSIGYCDLELRPCLETNVDIYKDNN